MRPGASSGLGNRSWSGRSSKPRPVSNYSRHRGAAAAPRSKVARLHMGHSCSAAARTPALRAPHLAPLLAPLPCGMAVGLAGLPAGEARRAANGGRLPQDLAPQALLRRTTTVAQTRHAATPAESKAGAAAKYIHDSAKVTSCTPAKAQRMAPRARDTSGLSRRDIVPSSQARKAEKSRYTVTNRPKPR